LGTWGNKTGAQQSMLKQVGDPFGIFGIGVG
jgi:hypothetical protein